MSGTLAHERAAQQARREKLACDHALRFNRATVQSRLEALVCEAAGWSKIEAEFQTVIAMTAAGNIVDVAALDAKIAAWKAAQTPPAETEVAQ